MEVEDVERRVLRDLVVVVVVVVEEGVMGEIEVGGVV